MSFIDRIKNHWKMIAFCIVGIFFCIMIIIGFFIFGAIPTFFMVWPWITSEVAEQADINIWLARSISVVTTVWLLFCFKNLFTFDARKRNMAMLMLAANLLVFCGTMYYVQRNWLFDRQGNALVRQSVQPDGSVRIVGLNTAFDPYTGRPTQLMTPDDAQVAWVNNNGVPQYEPFIPNERTRFFAPNGQAMVWYYEHSGGKLEFFKQPGVHPQLGPQAMLLPVNAQVIRRALNYIEKGEGAGIVGITKQPGESLDKYASLKALRDALQQSKAR